MKSETKAKLYYRDEYHFQKSVNPNNIYIYGYISSLQPKNLFEFGCNVGRHLNEFRKQGIDVSGIDVSARAIELGKELYGLENIRVGDESSLKDEKTIYDVVYVNSVLCHIDNIDDIIVDLKKISKTIIIFEAPYKAASQKTNMSEFWYPRDYSIYGFKKLWSFYAESCDATYYLYKFKNG